MKSDRAASMEARVLREARDRGVPGDLEPLRRALTAAMAVRISRLGDEHHPAFLHPGRTVLILLTDTGERDVTILAAASLVESLRGEWRVPVGTIRRDVGEAVARLRDSVPGAGGGGAEEEGSSGGGCNVLEALLSAPLDLGRVALAERLDHLRHLHLEADPGLRARLHADATTNYLPVAGRIDAVLGRRYAWWCDRFGRRHLTGQRPIS